MKNNIKVGDIVKVHKNNGLGQNPFVVIEVFEKDPIHKLMVCDSNGNRWHARIEGAKIVRIWKK